MAKKRSDILIELEENIQEMQKLISQQLFRVGDAMLFLERYYNITRKMEQLIISRNLWKEKYEKIKQKYEGKD